MTEQKEGSNNDEPPDLRCQRTNRHISRPFYPRGYERAQDTGRIGKYGNRVPVILLNHLYRSGRVVYFTCDIRGGCGVRANG